MGGASTVVSLSVALALFLSSPVLAAPPIVPMPSFLPGDAVIGPAAGLQEQPSVAAGGSGSLVVWADARSSLIPLAAFSGGPFLSPGGGTMRDIYAARLDAAGNLLDSTPIVVNATGLNQGSPKVSWNGQNWLVVWMGQAGLTCCPNVNIYAARVSPTGEVLDNPPIVVDTDATTGGLYWPTVASDGAFWAVAWRDLDIAAGIFTIDGARISPGGTVFDIGGKHLRRDTINSYPIGPQLAYAAGQYMLVWNEASNRVMGQRLSTALDLLGGAFQLNTLAGSIGKNPRVASDGLDFFATWFEDRLYGSAQLFGTRVSAAGFVLDPAGIALTPAAGYTQFTSTVTWDGTQWIVAYNFQASGFNDDLCATRVSAAGALLGSGRIQVRPGAPVVYEPWAIPTAGGGARFVWQEMDGSAGDIFTTSITAAGAVGTVLCVSVGTPRQSQPRFVSNGNGYLAVFLSETSSASRVLGQRFGPAGTLIDAEPFEIAAGSAPLDRPSVAWDGQRYLVTWSDKSQSRVYARRVALNGVPIDGMPIFVMRGDEPDVVALDSVFLVAATYNAGTEFQTLYSTRVRGSDGALLDTAPVVVGTTFAIRPTVTALGGRWLVTWRLNVNHDDTRSDIYANFVDASGIPGTAFGVTATPITSESDPYVVTGPDMALVVWTNGADLLGRRIQADGTLLDPGSFVVSAATGLQDRPAVSWDGSEYTVLFRDFRNDDPNGPYVGDAYGARVSSQGLLLDPDGFAFLNDPRVQEAQATVAGASGGTLLGCAAFRNEVAYQSYRIAYSMIGNSTTDVGRDWTGPLSVSALPNPARGKVAFVIRGPEAMELRGSVQDILGRTVYRFSTVGTGADAGVRTFHWDGRDARGVQMPAGVYFVKVDAGGLVNRTKLVIF
ncbi:MAG: hypothetical protein A2W26_08975 [Acidobacteria bacterium RBG_16_64_8]|nr:MAG: hypothetical protein A2W26_08975 [Acidobacteria bacterium RBG_16_64_8]